jgi:hypothetical protein
MFGRLPLGQFSSKLLDLIKFGRGSAYDSTQYLKSDGRGKWVLAPQTAATLLYTTLIGDGTTNPWIVTHSLGTTDVVVVVKIVSTGEIIEGTVKVTDANHVSINFAFEDIPTANQYAVTVLGGGSGVGVIPPTRLGFLIVKTSGTSYTPSANVKMIWVRGVGGGGGGAGALGGASLCAIGGCGGGGAYFEKFINNLGAGPFTYAIGAAGAGGATTPTAGGNGGNTTFNDGVTTYTAGGGVGGTLMTAGSSVLSPGDGAGGVATNGDLNVSGQGGSLTGLRTSGTVAYKSKAGNAALGWGYGTNRQLINFNANIGGETLGQSGFGAGGQGGLSFSAVGAGGSAGLAGVLVIMEFT